MYVCNVPLFAYDLIGISDKMCAAGSTLICLCFVNNDAWNVHLLIVDSIPGYHRLGQRVIRRAVLAWHSNISWPASR
jgi:hypothetical protein